MFDEIKEKMSEVINLGYTGVLLELSNACLRLKCKQALFFKVNIIVNKSNFISFYTWLIFNRHYVSH